ncbi:hypothetical protein Clacol_010118 [Clathrus columnatus]|uniref:Uncharacterized protein n=1 Tax=Clathrus columnatus TaxID=1419009 RepID=A0AAV5AN24_9AGAM|nr:hypothetical protein Clacol_010118 [Clathrus columnatus]
MVSFTSLIVLATAGFSAVSAIAIPKRDLADDITTLSALVEQFDSDVKAIDPQQDASTTISTILGDIYAINTALLNASISENETPISDDQIPSFKGLLGDFTTLITDIDAQVPTIEQVPGLAEEMAEGLIATEGFAIGYVTTVASDISNEHLDDVVQILVVIEQGFEDVENKLLSNSSTSSTPSDPTSSSSSNSTSSA